MELEDAAIPGDLGRVVQVDAVDETDEHEAKWDASSVRCEDVAEELDSQKFYAGALYQYLEATRHFAMLDAPPLDEVRQSALKADLAAARKRLLSSKQDDSLAQLFLERAESQTVHADGSAPSPDEWRSSRVILDQVLPAYFAARKPAFPLRQPSRKTVDITLVRWPYT